jgi:hypothetical protein
MIDGHQDGILAMLALEFLLSGGGHLERSRRKKSLKVN